MGAVIKNGIYYGVFYKDESCGVFDNPITQDSYIEKNYGEDVSDDMFYVVADPFTILLDVLYLGYVSAGYDHSDLTPERNAIIIGNVFGNLNTMIDNKSLIVKKSNGEENYNEH